VDIGSDQGHPVEDLDARFGGFIGVPPLDQGSTDGSDIRFAAEHDNPIGDVDHRIGELLAGDVDVDLSSVGADRMLTWPAR
jgi:hypothetical protein